MLPAGKKLYAGVLLISLCTLTLETLFVRIFSVTMWYHYAFLAVSVAMLGMTLGAVAVYAYPGVFKRGTLSKWLTFTALGFAIATPISLGIHLLLPFRDAQSWKGILSLGFEFILLATPFFFSGVNLTLIFTRHARDFRKLYAFDLLGAALGCLAFLLLLELTDGVTAALLVSAAGMATALVFADGRKSKLSVTALVGLLLTLCLSISNFSFGWLDLYWVKGEKETPAVAQSWNSFSRIRVTDWHPEPNLPFCWGISPVWDSTGFEVPQKLLQIDGFAGSVLTGYDGDIRPLDYLRYDCSNFAHHLVDSADVLVIGVGGGRDILSAHAFGQKHVTGLEVNPDILQIVNGELGDFTGHLDQDPRVTFIAEEARSHLEADTSTYNLIQVSMIDTWAATVAGAYSLAENSLYTVEAWETLLRRLRPGGIVTFSRWYMPGISGETYRLASLAGAALRNLGVAHPENHFLLAAKLNGPLDNVGQFSIGTAMVSATPFSSARIQQAAAVCDSLQFTLVAAPGRFLDSTYYQALAAAPDGPFFADFPIDISATTDDRPFFFNMLRLDDLFDTELLSSGSIDINMRAIRVLGALLGITFLATTLLLLVPVWIRRKELIWREDAPFFGFFSLIGIGFMLVEMSQMQRLTLFLGNPAYSISVVLATLLVATGLGSYLVRQTDFRRAMQRMGLLVLVLLAFGWLTMPYLHLGMGLGTAWRVLVAILLMLPMGIVMGMAMPTGMALANVRRPGLLPWLWGANGGASVFASVLSVALSIAFGISFAYWAGVACYVVAGLMLVGKRG